MDSEFIVADTWFDEQSISIFQISNDKQAFIFDMEKISHMEEFQQFFFGLLSNKSIIKVPFKEKMNKFILSN